MPPNSSVSRIKIRLEFEYSELSFTLNARHFGFFCRHPYRTNLTYACLLMQFRSNGKISNGPAT